MRALRDLKTAMKCGRWARRQGSPARSSAACPGTTEACTQGGEDVNSKRARSPFILGLVLALLLTGCAAPAPSEASTLVAVNLETLEASEPFA